MADPIGSFQQAGSQYSQAGDIGHEFLSATGGAAASVASSVGWVADVGAKLTGSTGMGDFASQMNDWRSAANDFSRGQDTGVSPTTQTLMDSPILSAATSNPMMYLGGTIAKLAPSLVATIAATALTGGLADGLMAAGAAAAVREGTTFAGWGGITAGEGVNQIYSAIDNVSDAQLQDSNPVYKKYRDDGMDEKKARAAYRVDVASVAPAVLFAVGGLAGTMGGPGQLSRALGGEVAHGIVDGGIVDMLKRTATGAAVGGTVGAGQGAATTGIVENNLGGAKLGTFNGNDLVSAALSGGVLGAAMGGIAEGPIAGLGKATADRIKAKSNAKPSNGVTVEAPAVLGGDAATQAAMESATPKAAPQAAPEVAPIPQVTAAEPTPDVLTPQQTKARLDAEFPPLNPESAPPAAPAPPVAAEPTPVAPTPEVPTAPVAPAPGAKGVAAVKVSKARASKTKVVAPEPVPVPAGVTPAPVAEAAPEAPVAAPEPTPVPEPIPAPTPEPTPTPAPIEAAPAPMTHEQVFKAATSPPEVQGWIKQIADNLGAKLSEVTKVLAETTKGHTEDEIHRAIYDKKVKAEEAQERARAEKEAGVEGATGGGKGQNRSKDTVQAFQDAKADADTLLAHPAHQYNPDTEGRAAESRGASVPAHRAAVIARLEALVADAKDHGIKIPTNFRDNTDKSMNPNASMWRLKLAKILLGSKRETKDFSDYQSNEFLLRDASPKELAAWVAARHADGEAAHNAAGGNTEKHADTGGAKGSGLAPSATDISSAQTKIPGSKQGGPKEAASAGAASEGKKIELTPELKAQYQAIADKATAEAKKAAEAKEAPKGVTKAAEIKAKPPTKSAADVAAKINAIKAKARGPSTAKEIKLEAAKVETNPTEAQKEAGNYEKGHVNVHGLDITIENAKGSTREGVGPDGKPWSVKMPDHYGYIKGTVGADGDHVDTYLGPHPESKDVFLIDQKNADTGKFDEHKAMLGYENAVQAQEAYRAAFSDGKADQRVGGFQHMTIDEFKTWLKDRENTTKITPEGKNTAAALKEATKVEPDAPELAPLAPRQPSDDMSISPDLQAQVDALRRRGADRRKEVEKLAFKTTTAREVMDDISDDATFGTLAGGNKALAALAPSLIGRLRAILHNTPVYILEDNAFNAVDKLFDGVGDGLTHGFYHPSQNMVVLKKSSYENPEMAAHVVPHEMVHAAFKHATWNNPHIRDVVNLVAKEADAAGGKMLGGKFGQYAFTNVDEFIAVSFSNPDFQSFLASVDASPALKERLGLSGALHTMWDAMVSVVRDALGLPRATGTLLNAMMRIGDHLESEANTHGTLVSDQSIIYSARGQRRLPYDLKRGEQLPEGLKRVSVARIEDHPDRLTGDAIGKTLHDVRDAVEGTLTGKGRLSTGPSLKMMRVRTLDMIATAAKTMKMFVGDPVRKVFNGLEATGSTARKLSEKWSPDLEDLHTMMDKYKGDVADQFTSLMNDSTIAGVWPNKDLAHADNGHVSKGGYKDSWQRAAHADLKARFDALPEDLKATYERQAKHYGDIQDQATLETMSSRLMTALGVKDPLMAKRIFDGTETDADKAALGDAYDAIKQAGVLNKIEGPYFPQMRHGDHVVVGYHDVVDPKATSYVGREGTGEDAPYVFKSKDDASKFATYDHKGEVRDLKPSITSKYVDATTGSPWGVVPDGEKVRITKEDTNSEQRFYVKIQNQHTEFVDGRAKGEKTAFDLQQAGLKRVYTQPREITPGRPHGAFMSHDIEAVMKQIERGDAYKNMSDAEQRSVQDAVNHIAVRLLGSNRIASRSLPRRYVAGASRDVVKNAYTYDAAMSHYLAKLQHGKEVDDALTDMHTQAKSDASKPGSYGRMDVYNEVAGRVFNYNPLTGDIGKYSGAVKRVMLASFLSKMLSPAHSVVHMVQPALLSYPVLAARHGMGTAARAFSKAYADIGALSTLTDGAKGAGARIMGKEAKTTSLIEDIIGRTKTAGEKAMMRFLVDHGTIHPDAGFDMAHMTSDRSGIVGQLDKGLNYFDGIAREFPRAVEAVNRSVIALSAYRLELAKTGDHQKALEYAQETVNMTEGVYSKSNNAPIFNHPLARISLQFKQYGQMVYGLLGHQIGKAVHNSSPGDRAEALKALAGIAATHIAIAGTLGLPTEPFKWLLLGAHIAGLTGYTWSNVEDWEREVLAKVAGKGAGEVLAHGITRALPGGLAFDVSGRLGLADLMTFGEPKSSNPNDLWNYFGQLIGGAPGSLAADYIKGSQALASGDFATAGKLMIPIKAAGDAIGAYQKLTQGKMSKTGNQTMEPYSLQEALVRTFGFIPGREAENNDLQNKVYEGTRAQSDARTTLQQDWYKASPADRMRLMGRIEAYNQSAPQADRLSRSQLDTYTQRRQSDITSGRVTNGLLVTPRNRNVMDDALKTYNN